MPTDLTPGPTLDRRVGEAMGAAPLRGIIYHAEAAEQGWSLSPSTVVTSAEEVRVVSSVVNGPFGTGPRLHVEPQ